MGSILVTLVAVKETFDMHYILSRRCSKYTFLSGIGSDLQTNLT